MAEPLLEEEQVAKETWTEDDLKQAVKKINAGEININDAQSAYGIPPRVIHRQRAIENMRAQLNPDRAMKKQNKNSRKGDVTVKRQPMEISCTSIADLVELLQTSKDEEVKHILSYECNIIYECKICRSLFRSLSNFISHKRAYCRSLHKARENESEDDDEESSCESFETICKKPEMKPVRTTCKKDLTFVIDKLFMLHKNYKKPVVHLESIDKSSLAFYQSVASLKAPIKSLTKQQMLDLESDQGDVVVELEPIKETPADNSRSQSPKPCDRCGKCHPNNKNCGKIFRGQTRFGCPCCDMYLSLKKSVIRHLKTVHHKSVEQIIRLKSRIRIDHISSGRSESLPNETSVKNRNNIKPNGKYNCQYCHKFFVRKKELAYHVRKCDKRISKVAETEKEIPNMNSINLPCPVVTLTPISIGSLPNNVQSNKIGIQLRMNYGKSTNPSAHSANNRYSTRANANSNYHELCEENGIHTNDAMENHNHETTEEENISKVIDGLLPRENVDEETEKKNNQLRVNDIVNIEDIQIPEEYHEENKLKSESEDEDDLPLDKWCMLIKDDEFSDQQETKTTYKRKGRILKKTGSPSEKKLKLDQSNGLEVVPISLMNGNIDPNIEFEAREEKNSKRKVQSSEISHMKMMPTIIQ